MTEVPDQLVEISGDLYEAATREAAARGLTVRQQLEHWVRVGRVVTQAVSNEDAGREPRPAGTLHQLASSVRKPETNAELDAKIAAAVEAANFGATLAAQGLTTVALDDEGRLVEYRSDGTTSFL